MVKKHLAKDTSRAANLDHHFKEDLANKIKVEVADKDYWELN